MDDEATRGGTALSACSDSAEYGARDNHFELGIRLYNDGVVAAKFEEALAQTGGHGLSHNLAHAD